MLLLIAAIECQEDRDLMTEFHNTKLMLLYHEAGKFISGKENVEDIVYESFAKIIEKIDVFRMLKPKQQDRYAVVTVRNLCYHHLRKEKQFSVTSFEELLETADLTRKNEPEQITERMLFDEQVRNVISRLNMEERMILEQKYFLLWSVEEIAQMHGVKTQSMRMKLTRTKRKLFKLMQEQGFQVADWLA